MTLSAAHYIIGNPENRRVHGFQDALRKLGFAPARVLSYAELLSTPTGCENRLRKFLGQQNQAPRILRVESPGENELVWQRLVAYGEAEAEGDRDCGRITSKHALVLRPEVGRLQFVRQWYLGFRKLLSQMETVGSEKGVRWHNHPQDIALAFDKLDCQERLEQLGVSVPERIPVPSSLAELGSDMADRRWKRVFVKLRHGSSANGVLAVTRSQGGELRIVTPLEAVSGRTAYRFYHRLRSQVYDTHDRESRAKAEHLFAFLRREGILVEQWLPKTQVQGQNYDLRQVVVLGQPMHCVVRCAKGPLTNLHLGNRRGDVGRVRQTLGEEAWRNGMRQARRAASLMERSLYLGIDLMFCLRSLEPVVLEINAFGDLLPDLLFEGYSTYEQEILESLRSK